MHCTLDTHRAAAMHCSSQCRHVMRISGVSATQLTSAKPTFSSTLWPSQQSRLQQLNLGGSHGRLAACQAGPTPPPPVPAATFDFSPHVDSTVLASQLLVLAVTLGAAAYWWWSVVPSARRTLAKEKRSGPLKEYLVELQENPDKGVERWFYTDWLQQLQRRQQLAAQAAAKRAAGAAGLSATATSAATSTGAAPQAGQQPSTASQGVAADDVPLLAQQSTPQQQQQQQQPPAEEPYVDKEPNFWSLDNPLLATAAMLAAIGVVSTVLHGSP